MSIIIEIFVHCDSCGRNAGVDTRNDTTAKQQRKRAKDYGWINKGIKDYCDECVKEGKHKTKPTT